MRRHHQALVTVLAGSGVSTYFISGVVYDADGTTPVEGATVTLGALSAVSGADGAYTISDVPPGVSGSMTCTLADYSWTAITIAAMSGNLTAQNYTNAWWAAAGCAASCVFAYRPIGAVSLAASYINLVNPGTYNAAPGVAPTWNANDGWIFNGTTQYLLSGFTPAGVQTKSALVRFAGADITSGSTRTITGESGAVTRAIFRIYSISTGDKYFFSNGTGDDAGGNAVASGVLGIAGLGGWLNGTKTTTLTKPQGTNSAVMAIGGTNIEGTVSQFYKGNVQAMAEYNVTLSDAQMAAVSAAMAALANP